MRPIALSVGVSVAEVGWSVIVVSSRISSRHRSAPKRDGRNRLERRSGCENSGPEDRGRMTGETDRGDRLAWADGLEAAAVWREFAALSAIPRKSKQEHAARGHVIERLAELGLSAEVDDAGNVIA